jgi:hypothetical protein
MTDTLDDRGILDYRLKTLDGLLGGRSPLEGATASSLTAQLRNPWQAESRLLRRLLEDAEGSNVRDTVQLWHQRTSRFLESSKDEVPGWVDGKGVAWDARLVLELLAETQERLERWTAAPGPIEPEPPAAATAV